MTADLTPRAFTIAEYRIMAESGMFEGERVELLDGVISMMPPIGISHWGRHWRIVRYLNGCVADRVAVHGQLSLPLDDRNEPEPDIAILSFVDYERRGSPPELREIFAMIEISQASLARDMQTKRRLYARFAIPDYLVVDLAANELVHFSKPRCGDYACARRMGTSETFELFALPGLALESDGFLL